MSAANIIHAHSKALGTLLCAGMGEYIRKEPSNMQALWKTEAECLASRIEIIQNGIIYSSIYEPEAQVTVSGNGEQGYVIQVDGSLKNQDHQVCEEQDYRYHLCYHIQEQKIQIQAECPGGTWICPVISSQEEKVTVEPKRVILEKEKGVVCVQADSEITLPFGTKRIFHPIPGFQAVKLEKKVRRKYNDLEYHMGDKMIEIREILKDGVTEDTSVQINFHLDSAVAMADSEKPVAASIDSRSNVTVYSDCRLKPHLVPAKISTKNDVWHDTIIARFEGIHLSAGKHAFLTIAYPTPAGAMAPEVVEIKENDSGK